MKKYVLIALAISAILLAFIPKVVFSKDLSTLKDTFSHYGNEVSTQNRGVHQKNTRISFQRSKQSQAIQTATFNVGSRYITIAYKGERFCYEGISIPSGRYAVAVGETVGSLTYDGSQFVIDGWRRYGRQVSLSIQNQSLFVTSRNGLTSEYPFLSSSFGDLSNTLIRCINSSGFFFETAPGYTIEGSP